MTTFTLQLFPSRAYITVQAATVIDAANQVAQYDVDYFSFIKNDRDSVYNKPLKTLYIMLR